MFERRNAGKLVLAALALAVPGLLASCGSTVDTWSAEDYIGAADRHGPPRTTTQLAPATTSAPTSQPAGALQLSVADAILMSLENNASLVVDRLNPPIRRTFEQEQRAAFDPDLTGQVSAERSRSRTTGATGTTESMSKGAAGNVALTEFLPTGTTIDLGASENVTRSLFNGDFAYATRLGMSVTQSLLRGGNLDANLASLRQARLDTLSSQYELRGFAQSLVAQVEETYWDYVLAERQIGIYQSSLAIAQQQMDEIRERINVGKLAETERVAAEAEVALRREALIVATGTLETTRLQLLRLVNPPGGKVWDRQVRVQALPQAVEAGLDSVENHVALALRMRPDLNQARLQVARDELEIVKTRNGLLPKLDLFITLGKTGYANSFGQSVSNLDQDTYDFQVGLTGELSPLNRAARARNSRALLTRQQANESLNNMAQSVELDVRTAYTNLKTAQEDMRATAATRRLQEEKLRTETEKFRVGRSTALLVGQAQRDLLASQIAEVQAVVKYLKGFVELYRLEGSLLEYRAIAAPGGKPADVNSREPPQVN